MFLIQFGQFVADHVELDCGIYML